MNNNNPFAAHLDKEDESIIDPTQARIKTGKREEEQGEPYSTAHILLVLGIVMGCVLSVTGAWYGGAN